jgi:hypothetical protein
MKIPTVAARGVRPGRRGLEAGVAGDSVFRTFRSGTVVIVDTFRGPLGWSRFILTGDCESD